MDSRGCLRLEGVRQTNVIFNEERGAPEAHFEFTTWEDVWSGETWDEPCCLKMKTAPLLHPALRPHSSVLNWSIRENGFSIQGPICLNDPALNLADLRNSDSGGFPRTIKSIRLFFSHSSDNLKIRDNLSWAVELNAKDLTRPNGTSLPTITVWDVIDRIRHEMYKKSGDSAPSLWKIPTDQATRVRPSFGGGPLGEDSWRLIDYFGLEKVVFDGLLLEPCMKEPGHHFRVLFREVRGRLSSINIRRSNRSRYRTLPYPRDQDECILAVGTPWDSTCYLSSYYHDYHTRIRFETTFHHVSNLNLTSKHGHLICLSSTSAAISAEIRGTVEHKNYVINFPVFDT